MRHDQTRPCSVWGLARILFLALLAFASGAGPLAAQRFQEGTGGTDPNGEIGNAVIEAANGEIVTAGTAYSMTGAPLAYVVRFDAHGSTIWQYTYDIDGTGNSTANDIKEYPNGDLVVVGTTGVAGSTHAYAMRIDAAGTLIWCTTLTKPGILSEGTGVVIAQQGDGVTTFADDIILCGKRDPSGGTYTQAMLARLDASGVLVWGAAYDFTSISGGQFAGLNGVDETQIPSVAANVGDIVAVGWCDDAANGFPAEVLYLRVDGNTGQMNAAPLGAALYGGSGTEIGHSIQELRYGANPGDVVMTGITDSRPAPSSATEVFVQQALADPCDATGPRASEYFGDDATGRDRGLCVREIPSAAVGTVGNVVVSGTTTAGAYLPSIDAFMQEFQEGTMAQVGGRDVYGGVGNDGARSIAPVQFAPTTPGFVFTVSTTTGSIIVPGTTRDLYLVKTDAGHTVPCSSASQAMTNASTGWTPNCVTPTILRVPYFTDVTLTTMTTGPTWGVNVACYTPFKAVGSDRARPTTIAPAEPGLHARPNPVRRGAPVLLDVKLAVGSTVLVTATDILGRVVHEERGSHGTGAMSLSIPTDDWPAGTYVVTVRDGEHRSDARVVVVDR